MNKGNQISYSIRIVICLTSLFLLLKTIFYWKQIVTSFINDKSMLFLLSAALVTLSVFFFSNFSKRERSTRNEGGIVNIYDIATRLYLSTFLILLFYLAGVNYGETRIAQDFPPLAPFINGLFLFFFPFFIWLSRYKNPLQSGLLASLPLIFIGFDFALSSSMVFTLYFLLIVFWIIERSIESDVDRIPYPYIIPIFLIYLSSFCSSFLSSNIYNSLNGFQPYNVIFIFFLLLVCQKDSKGFKNLIEIILIAGNIFFVGICFTKLIFNINYKSLMKAITERLWISDLLPPTYLSENLIIFVMIVFGILLYKDGVKRFLLGILITIDLILLGVMRSKGSLLGLFAGIAYLAFLFLLKRNYNSEFKTFMKTNSKKIVSVVCLVIIIASVIIFCNTSRIEKLMQKETVSYRLFIWEVSLKLLKHHPIFGGGYENQYQRAMIVSPDTFYDYDIANKSYIFTTTHNMYIAFAENLGLFGLLVFLCLIFTILKRNLYALKVTGNKREWFIVWSIGGTSIAFFFNIFTATPSNKYLFILFLLYALQEHVIKLSTNSEYNQVPKAKKVENLFFWLIIIFSALSFFSLPVINRISGSFRLNRILPEFSYRFLNAQEIEKMGVDLFLKGQNRDSLDSYKHAALAKRNFAMYYHIQGLFEWLINNNPSKAFSLLQKCDIYDPLDINEDEYYLDAGIVAAAAGNKEDAVNYLQKALYKDPHIINIYWRRVGVKGTQKREYDLLNDIEIYNKTGKFTPALDEIVRIRITMLLDRFKKIEDIRPIPLDVGPREKDSLYFPLLQVLDRMKEHILTLPDKPAGLKAESYHKLAMCYKNIRRLEHIVEVLEDTDYLWNSGRYGLDLAFMLGETYTNLEEWEKAVDVYKKVGRNYEIALSYKHMGKLDDAEKYFHDAINKTGTSLALEMRIKSYRGLADLYEMKGEFDKAIQSFNTLLQLEKHPNNYDLFADFLFRMENREKALNLLHEGLENFPDNEKLTDKIQLIKNSRNYFEMKEKLDAR